MKGRMASVVAAACLLAASGAGAADEEFFTIPTRPDATVGFVVTRPDGEPKAAALLFTGGHGKIFLWRGQGARTNNFLVRTRAMFAARGVLAVTVDAPSDRRKAGLFDFRATPEHQADIAAVLRWVRARSAAPVWLIGTSRGTVSVAHLAARLPVEGAVFTSSVTRASRRYSATVLDGALESIRMPVLLVHHRQDLCYVTPPEDVPAVAARLRHAAKLHTLLFDGGRPPESEDCQAKSAHGFFGIEAEVVEGIVRWMVSARPR